MLSLYREFDTRPTATLTAVIASKFSIYITIVLTVPRNDGYNLELLLYCIVAFVRLEYIKLENCTNSERTKLTTITNLSLKDEEFVYNVNADIEEFLKQHRHNNCVLLFPPVNNFRRFLIHQTCENIRTTCSELFTFSVGQGPYRRTVVCFKNQLLDSNKFVDNARIANIESHKESPVKNWRNDTTTTSAYFAKRDRKMGVEKNLNDSRLHKSDSLDLYRPPALRNHHHYTTATKTRTSSSGTNNGTVAAETVSFSSPYTSCSVTSSSSSSSTSTTTTTTSISHNSSPIHINEGSNSNSNSFDNTTAAAAATTTAAVTSTNAIGATIEQDSSAIATTTCSQQRRRERRPDRAVYIPRARRSQTTPPTTTTTATSSLATVSSTPTTTTVTNNHNTNNNNNCLATNNIIQHQQLPITSDNKMVLVSKAPSFKADETGVDGKTVTKKSKSHCLNAREQRNKERSAAAAKKQSLKSIHADKKTFESFELNHPTESTLIFANQNQNCDIGHLETQHPQQQQQQIFETEQHCCEHSSVLLFKETSEQNLAATKNAIATTTTNNAIDMTQRGDMNVTEKSNVLLIEDVVATNSNTPSISKCDIDEQELQRASKEINRSNRRIMKQTFVSDVLEIPDKIDQELAAASPVTLKKQLTADSATEGEDEDDDEVGEEGQDDWENMYDESGECLDPKIIQELTASVGKVKIELPKMDYSAYLTKQSILNEEEFPHVLEVSNFPVEFKNQDLLMVFSQYKGSGFDIKWVDDTHALAVFSSSQIAAEVLTMGHPFVVLKPLAEATLESRLKAKKCAASLQPYRQRPETCAALARRLVTGALGVRLKTAAQERENEKRVLREAKERKLLAAKQRDEAWES